MAILRFSPVQMSKWPKVGFLLLLLISFFLSGTVSQAENPLQGKDAPALQNEFCLSGGLEDSFDLSGVEAGTSYSIVIRNISGSGEISYNLVSGSASTEKRSLAPARSETVPFTPEDTSIVLNIDNTSSTQQSCLNAYVKELPATNISLDIPDKRCVPANQSLARFVSGVASETVFSLTVENTSTENDLIISTYGSGFPTSRSVSVKAEKKAVFTITTGREGSVYLRLNNLNNTTESCASILFHMVGKAPPKPTLTPAPSKTSASVTKCIPGSELFTANMGEVVAGNTYRVSVYNVSTEHAVSASLSVGLKSSQVFDIGPSKTVILTWLAPQSGTLNLKVDNRANLISICISAIRLSSTTSSGIATPRPFATTSKLAGTTKCVAAGGQDPLVLLGSIVAYQKTNVYVSNLSSINTITVSFTRVLATSKPFKINPGTIATIALTSSSSGPLYMQIDNRGNATMTCITAYISLK